MSELTAESVEVFGEETDTETRTAVFDMLTDEVRRAAIEYLAMETGTASVDELAGFVAAMSAAIDSRQRTEIQFHHVHLPKLDASGLIDYDQDTRTVTPTEALNAAHQFIDQETDMDNQ